MLFTVNNMINNVNTISCGHAQAGNLGNSGISQSWDVEPFLIVVMLRALVGLLFTLRSVPLPDN